MRAMRIIIGVVLLSLVPSMALATTFDVAIEDEGFNPSAITIMKGDTVRWTNRGTHIHSVTRSGQFASGLLSPGVSFEYTFTSSGYVQYDLMNFPYPFTEITGKITVLGNPVFISPASTMLLGSIFVEQNIDLYISAWGFVSRFQIIFDGAVVFDGDYQNLITFFKSLDNNARAVPGGGVLVPLRVFTFGLGVHTLTVKATIKDWDSVEREYSDTAVYTVLDIPGLAYGTETRTE